MAHHDFIYVSYPEPHVGRTKEILKAHPEVKTLFGNTPITALYAFGIVGLQVFLAIYLRDSSIWSLLLCSYIIGAAANHALFVIIHECAHNLAFVRASTNQALGIFANLPIIFPSAISFKKFHLVHHRHQGEMDFDADLPSPAEARVVGNGPIRKSLWLLFFFIAEGIIRPIRVSSVKIWDRWTVANVVIELGFLITLSLVFGIKAFAYLALSTLFSIGLHPLGARWIQEHYVFKKGQETYSYYGSLNKICFNVGYHNEHHDLVRVPWSRLPQVRAMAPEFYNNLYFHTSWTRLLFQFLLDPKTTLFNRAVRPSRHIKAHKPVLEKAFRVVPEKTLDSVSAVS